jgi:hypothetical protein
MPWRYAPYVYGGLLAVLLLRGGVRGGFGEGVSSFVNGTVLGFPAESETSQ